MELPWVVRRLDEDGLETVEVIDSMKYS